MESLELLKITVMTLKLKQFKQIFFSLSQHDVAKTLMNGFILENFRRLTMENPKYPGCASPLILIYVIFT